MSAGGSSYPVTFLLQVRGDREVISAAANIRSSFSQLGSIGQQAAGGLNQAGTAATSASRQIGALSSATSAASTSAGRMSAVYNSQGQVIRGAAAEVTNLGRSYSTTISPMNQAATAAERVGTAAQTQAKSMTLQQTVMQGIRPHITGLAIGFAMMANSMSEAAMMGDVVKDAQARQAESQARVNALLAQGKDGTAEMSRAQATLAKDTRALTLFQRNANQAWMDQINFVVLIGAQLGPVIKSTLEFAKAQAGAATMTELFSKALRGLTIANIGSSISSAAGWLTNFSGSAKTAATAATGFGTAATAASAGTAGLAAGIGPLAKLLPSATSGMSAFVGSAAAGGGALSTLGVAAGNAGRATTLMSGAMMGLKGGIIGLIAVGATLGTIYALWKTNLFGARDALIQTMRTEDEYAKTHDDLIASFYRFNESIRKGVLNALGLLPEEFQQSEAAASNFQTVIDDMSDIFAKFQGNATKSTTEIDDAFQQMAVAIRENAPTDVIEKLQKSITDMQVQGARSIQAMSDSFITLGGDSEDLYQTLKVLGERIPANFENINVKTQAAVNGMIAAFGKIEPTTDQVNTAIAAIIGRNEELARTLPAEVVPAVIKVIESLKGYGNETQEAEGAIKELTAQLQPSTKAIEQQAQVIEQNKSAMDNYKDRMLDLVKSGAAFAQQVGITDAAILSNGKSMATLGAASEEYVKEQFDSEIAVRSHAAALQMLHPELVGTIDVFNAGVDSLKDWIANTEDADTAMKNAHDTLRQMEEGFHNSRAANDLLIQSLNKTGVAFSGTDEEAAAFAAALVDQRKSAEEDYATLVKNAVALGYIGDTSREASSKMKDFVDTVGAEKKAEEDAAKAKQELIQKTQEEITKNVQLAESYGIVISRQYAASQAGKNFVDVVQTLGGNLDSAIKSARLFAVTHGVDIQKAMSASGKSLLGIITDFDKLDFSQEAAAKKAKESAEQFAEAWKQGLEKTKANFEKASSNFSNAMDTVFERLAKDLPKSAQKEGVGVKFVEDFWNRWFPTEIVEAKFQDHMNMDKLISGLKKNLDNALDNNQLTEAQAKRWFGGLTDFMDKLPKDAHRAFGELVGAIPNLREMLEPKLVMGTIEVGRKMQNAIKTEIVDKMAANLEAGKPAITGIEEAIAHMPKAAGVSAEQFKEVTGLFSGALKSAKGDTDLQVQSLLAIFDQINPAWAGVISQIDRDADNIPDIMDNKVGKPFEAMAQAIADALVKALEEFGLLPQKIGEAASGVAQHTQNISQQFKELSKQTGVSVSEMTRLFNEDLKNGFVGYEGKIGELVTVTNTEFGKTTKTIYDFKTGTITNLGEVAGKVDDTKTNVSGFSSEWDKQWGGAATSTNTNVTNINNDIDRLNATAAITTKLSIMWMGHEQVVKGVLERTTGYITTFIVNLGGLRNGISAVLTEATGSWTTYATTVGQQLVNIRNYFAASAANYGTYRTGVNQILVELSQNWATHATAVGLQSGRIGGILNVSLQNYIGYHTSVVAQLGQLLVGWVNHATGVGSQTTRIGGILGVSLQNYVGYRTNVIAQLGQLLQGWVSHATGVGNQVNRVGSLLGVSLQNYVGYRTNVISQLGQLLQGWINHATGVSNQVNRVANLLSTSLQHYVGYRSNVISQLNQINSAWNSSASSIASSASRIASSIESMASRIISADNRAISSLRSLQSQINSMHGTTITNTIRTVRTSSGSSGSSSSGSSLASHFNAGGAIIGQHGYFGIVDTPQNFRFGEGGSKELVAAIPVGKGRSSDASRMIQTLIQGTRGIRGGGPREVVIVTPIILDGKEIARTQRRHVLAGLDSMV